MQFRFKDTDRLKIKGWEKIYHTKSKRKRAIMSNKIDCKTKNVIKGHGGTFYSDNWSIYQ